MPPPEQPSAQRSPRLALGYSTHDVVGPWYLSPADLAFATGNACRGVRYCLHPSISEGYVCLATAAPVSYSQNPCPEFFF
eukprot:6469112-Amphidinium_carterae.2